MRNRKKRSRSKVWTWVSFVLFGIVITLLASSLIQKKSPAEVLKGWFSTEYDEGDLTTYEHDQLIDIVVSQRQKIDSISQLLDRYQRDYGVGRAKVQVDTDALNMRDRPSISGELIAKIPNGSIVGVVEFEDRERVIDGTPGRWYHVKYGEEEGWVWGNYLQILE